MRSETVKSPIALVIDDELQLRRLLRVSLEGNGYKVFEAGTGSEGLIAAASRRPDVVLLDLGLPDMEGVEVLKRLREWSQVPVIVLSVRDGEDDKVSALDNGADDYISKPFGTAELLARLRVAQRHIQGDEKETLFRIGHLEIDLVARTVKAGDRDIKVTGTEYALLRLFVTHAGKVLTHKQILREVWGPNSVEHTHYLRVYIKRLRDKIEVEPALPQIIVTEAGVGYRLMGSDL